LLLEKLRNLAPDAIVEQFGIAGSELVGSVFFDRESGHFLGDTIVTRSRGLRHSSANKKAISLRHAKSA
jgi:hypothetical protein